MTWSWVRLWMRPTNRGGEATMISCAGGVSAGFGLAALIGAVFPGLPFSMSLPYVVAAIVTSIASGC
jgi:hypothetical protein